MSNGTEQIEARLAAYIDGELPDSERAEIEKYLAANPAHRQMIEELKGQHLLVAALPREKAPAEILDHLQGHLERQSLLENVEDAAGSLRINRWPQFGAIAAMLLLTVGLGAIVYSVLPGGALNREQIAIAPPEMQGLPSAPSLTEDKDNKSPIRAKEEAADRERIAAPMRSADEAIAGHRADGMGDFVDKAAREFEAKRADDLRKALAENAKVSSDKPTLVSPLALNNGSAIVVSTDDPMITQNLLAGYLGQNEFDFHSVRPELARAATSLNELMTLPADDNSKKSQPVVGQQAIGAVVSRVNQRENAQPVGEQYMVVRNLSKDQAEKLNGVINSQRGARQQSRFYGNADLYPEYNSRPYNSDANPPAQQQLKQQESQEQQASQAQQGVQQYPQKIPPAGNQSNDALAAKADMQKEKANNAVTANGGGEGAGGIATNDGVTAGAPNTQPVAQAGTGEPVGFSDVLIVVRSESVAETRPAAAPKTLDTGVTEPSTVVPGAGGPPAPGVDTPPVVASPPAPPTVVTTAPELGNKPPVATQPATAPSTQPAATTQPKEGQ